MASAVAEYFSQAALYFPDIIGKALDTGNKTHTTDLCAGKISVVSMLSTKISEVGASLSCTYGGSMTFLDSNRVLG